MKPTDVSLRAVLLGLLLSLPVCLLSAYNDCLLNNTLFVGNHFPLIAIVAVMVLVTGVNGAARAWLHTPGLERGELLLIWGMVGIAGSLSSYSFVGYLPSFVVSPAYYASASNGFGERLLHWLPGWAVVSRDPAHPALRALMEGLTAGARIPWAAWAGALAAWGLFVAMLYGANFALCGLFYRHWADRERLIFPIVEVIAEVARPAPPGRAFNDFLRNRATWLGIAVPCVILGFKGLKTYIPGLPDIPTTWSFWSIFPDRPWSEFRLANAEVFFSVIGLTFLLTREVGFSCWFFFVLFRLSFVLPAWLGAGGNGFLGDWWTRVAVFETAGGMAALCVFLFWSARHSLRAWWLRVRGGKSDMHEDVLPPRLTFLLLVGGIAGMTAWHTLAGAQWWAGLAHTLLLLAMLLALTRVVAEAGVLFLGCHAEPWRALTGLVPASWLSGGTLADLTLHRGIHTEDMRKVFMPYVMNGLRAADLGRLKLHRAVWALVLAAVLGLAAGTYGFITTSHKYGAVNVETWASVMAPGYYLGDAVARQKNPPSFQTMRLGDSIAVPVNAAHWLTGALFVGVMLGLRAQFVWWPLHVAGFIMCGTWAMSRIWFSIFLGWFAKSCVMSFGGAAVYRRVLPFFLGLALGESVMAAFWMVIGLLTGRPGQQFVP